MSLLPVIPLAVPGEGIYIENLKSALLTKNLQFIPEYNPGTLTAPYIKLGLFLCVNNTFLVFIQAPIKKLSIFVFLASSPTKEERATQFQRFSHFRHS